MPPDPEGFSIGLSATRTLLIEGSKLYSPTGKDEHAVLSSPAMIMEMELACVDSIRSYIPASVGFHVDVKHIAPAPAGVTVETSATLIEIDGRKLRFKVETTFGKILIGTGAHRRAIIDY
ncbi:MAG: dihydrolipoamide acyltransferase [Dehalococcoidia bacterium]|jgi:predicted thioesterase|nr:dihydrolipoamide acyltransferase [Chloroflexota bacterium]MDP6056422.1 dihydrolipoamide acyltransferase [Dehalococcoidia bacterium]MDP7261944.1 dihydrolipoamide acyltransferase [Dehalococcoidia bacterium]MDP7485231.1 dihydrolipoamide acyltransferase [Dehalococcoidia bacterium]|tara:strand:+ start:365 stop:724 length:360 start_codon:yes stop_codon:yes gene_type:complete